MKSYTTTTPEFANSITIPEPTDTNHADNINSAPKQLLQNTLANKKSIEDIQENAEGMNESLYLAKSLAGYNGKNLGEIYTPAAFKEKVQSGDFSGLELGDYFDITLTTNEKMRYVISGFNTYLNYGDGPVLTANHVIMTPVDCMATTKQMKDTADNTGGYAGSLMPAYLETVLATFPAEWKSVMRAIRRLENNKGTWVLAKQQPDSDTSGGWLLRVQLIPPTLLMSAATATPTTTTPTILMAWPPASASKIGKLGPLVGPCKGVKS